MPPDDSERLSALGEARKRLYDPNAPAALQEESLPIKTPPALPHTWESAPSRLSIGAPHHMKFASRFFIAAVVFFVIAIGAATYLFYTGGNTVSVDNLALRIQGPTTVAGGDTVPLSVSITNKNPSTIDNVVLELTFPEGTRSASDVTASYPRFIESLGSLAPGQTIERTVSAVLFGSQGSQVVVSASVSFGTSRSNAVFVKPTIYPVTISTAPLSVAIDSVSETVSGKPFIIRATVRSNATQTLSGVVLQGQYPSGYLMTESTVMPVGTTFPIGDLKPGGSKTVTLTGVLNGQDSEIRVFHFTVGTAKSKNDPTLAVSYMTQQASVTISSPFLSTSFKVNGSSAASPAVAPGSVVTVGVSWVNALSMGVSNAEISVTLSGAAFDPLSVRSDNGFYRSSDHTIIFSRDSDPTLANIAPGSSGLGTFSFATFPNAPRNSAVTLTVSIAGVRSGHSGVSEQVSASGSKVIKLVSPVVFATKSLHAAGPFTNIGPVPPIAEKSTGYTVIWSVASTGNDLAGGTVSASLPQYVAFTGATSPNDGSVTYDESSRIVTWHTGEGALREAAFQVLVTPSIVQRGRALDLTSVPAFSAFDRFAQVQISSQGQAATTETVGDPGYTPTKAVVQ